MNKKNNITLCFFGDGASSQGLLAEALNLSSLYKLPLIFVCSNNQYSMQTSFREETVTENLADRAIPYKIPSFIVDGNDLEEVYTVAGKAVANAREGKGPTFIEAKTMRMRGHLEGDQETYRLGKEKEIEEWTKKDPLKRFTERVIDLGILDENDIKIIKNKSQLEIDQAVTFAKEAPYPPAGDLLKNVFCEN